MFFLIAAISAGTLSNETSATTESSGVAAVAMPDVHGANVAEAVLRNGGNAVDAAIAAAFTAAVTFPEAGNIGGGGFMLIYMNDEPFFLDYRETAPAAADRDMYLDDDGEVIEKLSLYGHRAIAVPGTVAGMWAAHERFGSLGWKSLIAPAIALAHDGFVIHPIMPENIQKEISNYEAITNFSEYWGAIEAGKLFKQPELAATLRRIAEHGRDGFYKGETAELIADEMQRGGGVITHDDLEAYQPVWREPLRADWRAYEILSAPLPSSGGFAVIQLLKMKEDLATEFADLKRNSPQYIHLIAEMEKRVFADRAEYLGDPDFVDVPMDKLIDDAYIASRAAEVDPVDISQLDSVRPGLEGNATTHFSIIDQWGNAVSNTYTLNTWFGSGVVVVGAGFLLNNQMDDFSAKPGVPNYYGVVGKSANAIDPGKRMLSSMSPTILLKNGDVSMVLGTPGGSTIFTTVFQVINNILDFGLTPEEAASAVRFHHQLLPMDKVTYTPRRPLDAAVIEALNGRGYNVVPHAYEYGDVQVIWNDDGTLKPGSDDRWRGESRVIH